LTQTAKSYNRGQKFTIIVTANRVEGKIPANFSKENTPAEKNKAMYSPPEDS
jgi:hypothetical protein